MYFSNRDEYGDIIEASVWGIFSPETWASLAILLIILETIIVVGNGHLIAFHIFIKCKGLTTYEWIMERRERLQRKEIAAAKDSPINIEIPSISPSRQSEEKSEDD